MVINEHANPRWILSEIIIRSDFDFVFEYKRALR